MDRNREARRTSIVGSNGFNRRKHRTNSLKDSPDDVGVELQESIKLRDRVKKDRDRERERDRGRDLRERERNRDLRERSGRSKRRRAERLMSIRDDIGTSDESENDDLDDEYEHTTNSTTTTSAVARLLPTAAGSISNQHESHLNHHNHGEQQHNTCNGATNSNMISGNHHLLHRKSFPPVSSSPMVYRTPAVWSPGDEMIGVSVPRKARSASTKRLYDWASTSSHNNSGGGGVVGGDQIFRKESSSPVRQGPTASPALPMSPSSSNASTRKKLKPSSGNSNGPKLKPPKGSLKPSSSTPEELEIEIAEVLYGLKTQSQAPSSKKEDSREVNRSIGDAKSRVSPPISNSTSPSNPIPGPKSTPLSAVAPKRKRPRQVLENPSHGTQGSPKPEANQIPKSEISSPNVERISGSTAENNGFVVGGNLVNSIAQPAAQPPEEPESMKLDAEPKPVVVAEIFKESRDLVAKEEVSSPKEKESTAARTDDLNRVDSASASMASIATDSVSATEIKENPVESEIENLREDKFQLDLMVAPPQVRSSPERDTSTECRTVLEEKPVLPVLDIELKPAFLKNQENENGKRWREESVNAPSEEEKGRVTGYEEAESNKEIKIKVINFDLKLDLENGERDGGGGVDATATVIKALNKPNKEVSLTERTGQSTNSLPLTMSMASWPGGLPHMRYMAAPLQGVVPMDGTSVTPPLQSFAQPRPKRCATHCYIARNIHSLQQFMKIHPFWPASPTLFGPKPCSLNVIPAAADLHGRIAVIGAHIAQDKGQNVANAPNHVVKDKGSQSVTSTDSPQRKPQQQILIQQGLPPVSPSNLLASAFIFPLNQHQAVAAASVRPTTGKSSSGGSTAACASNISSSGASSALVPAEGASAQMNFNYPNMAVNETQYLAILQNNAYPFAIPASAAVGNPMNYSGTPTQAMPVFNGSFSPSQMIHPSHIQQHQQQTPLPSTQSHQNASVLCSSSSSQKHLQSHHHQHMSQSSSGSRNTNAQNFPSQKTQQLQNQHMQRPKHLENEQGSEDSPSDNRGLHASMNIYGQNFTMPIHPQNFALMPPAVMANASSSGNQNEKKPQQPQQQPPPHSFAMSFGSINGAIPGPGIDLSSMAQNHAFVQSFPEAARQNLQMMAVAQVAQKNFRISEDGNNKSGGGDSSARSDIERKSSSVKCQSQSIAFAQSDLGDATSNVISSARSLNMTSGTARSSQAITNNIPNTHIQSQLQQQQMLQSKHHHQQHQHTQQQLEGNAANSQNTTPASNGSLYSEHLNAKFPNALSGFPQNSVQSNSNSPAQSPSWKSNSMRTPTSQAQSYLSSSTVKNLPQQEQQNNYQICSKKHTQISFGGTQKRPANSQVGQALPSNHHQAPSPPMAIGSPTTSSISKGASGSPRTTNSTSTNNKMGQASTLSAQQAQNSQAQKSMSILGNPSSTSGAKSQAQQQKQMAKNIQQQAQLYFLNPYSQAQSPHSTSSASGGPGGYFMQQQLPGGPSTSANGISSLCPRVTLGSSTGTNDPAKAIAAATCILKGGGLPSQGILHAAQFSAQLPAGFSYVHSAPTAVQVKPAEQKQPAGQPEKK